MTVVVDDRVLLDVLADSAPARIAAELTSGGVFTTSSWYYRLGRAASAGSGGGSLSGPFGALEPQVRQQVLLALHDLPDAIGLLHPRVVVPVMLTLGVRRQLNVLAADALAVAILVQGDLLVTTDAPLLRSGAEEMGLTYRVVD